MRLKLLVAAVVVLSLLVIWRMMSGGSSPADSLNTRMAELHRTGDVEALAVEAASPDIRTALRAVETMGYVGPKAVKQLRRALADRRPQIRQQAATAYAKVAGPKEVAPLVEIARADESSIVRACAITTLGKVRAHNEMETILDALNDKDLVVRRR
ncbi:MAG: HEAT repeat domain-containing protein, partial [Phycisphaerae bacterium]|nr:HEAT repeat domain-containing protein [Phycisphaerae bacterium]